MLKDVKIHYFKGLNGRATIVRHLLSYGNIEFTNNDIEFKDWPQECSKMDLGFLPNVDIGGEQFSQSGAIFFYIARKLGNLLGSSPEDEYEILQLLASDGDIVPYLLKITFASPEDAKDPEKMKTHQNNLVEALTPFFKSWEKRYVNHGSGKYYLGNTLSLADFWHAYMIHFNLTVLVPQSGETLRKEFPTFFKYLDNLAEDEVFKSFYNGKHFNKGVL